MCRFWHRSRAASPLRRESEVKVTPLDIRRKEFKRSVRGYSDEEVDLFLDEVADEFERLFQENAALQEKVQRLEEQAGGNNQLRDALEKTLVSAQLHADETRANARKESELILRDAELKARAIVADSYAETQRVQQALIQLKRLEEDFRFKFRSLLEGHLKLLDEAPIDIAPAQPVPVEAVSPEGETPFVVPAAVEEVPEYAPASPATARAEPSAATAYAVGAAAEDTTSASLGATVEAVAPREAELPASGESAVSSVAGPRPADPGDRGFEGVSATAETVELGSAFAEFDKVEAERGVVGGEDLPAGVTAEDSLTEFFLAGKLDDVDDVFLDSDQGGKSKARDFEW
jgi:cell division initiation protein